jgi:hypothetical protein
LRAGRRNPKTCLGTKKINFSTGLAGLAVGRKCKTTSGWSALWFGRNHCRNGDSLLFPSSVGCSNRQNVQWIIHDLRKPGLVAFEANPHHRPQPIVLTTYHKYKREELTGYRTKQMEQMGAVLGAKKEIAA